MYSVCETLEYVDELLQQLQSAEDRSMDFSPFLTKEHMLLHLLVHGTKPMVIPMFLFVCHFISYSYRIFCFEHLFLVLAE